MPAIIILSYQTCEGSSSNKTSFWAKNTEHTKDASLRQFGHFVVKTVVFLFSLHKGFGFFDTFPLFLVSFYHGWAELSNFPLM